MAGRKKIKILDIKRKNGRRLKLELDLAGEHQTVEVSVIKTHGIYGLELPDSLGLKLREFSPEESRKFVESIKQSTSTLRAA